MPGLALKLAPREQVLINGVIVENGPRRTQIVIMSEDAAVLRMREALEPSEVIGPASRAYFAAQTALAGIIPKDANCEAIDTFDTLAAHYRDEGMVKAVTDARNAFDKGNFYRAMRYLKPCVEDERTRMTKT